MTPAEVKHLDDATVLRILSEVTAELQESRGGPSAIRTTDEAVQGLETLLDQSGIPHRPISVDGLGDPAIGRALLARMLSDPETCPIAGPVVADPPADSQKSVELAMAGAVILGGLITWLQTSIEISLERKAGKTEFSFHLRKGASTDEVVKDTARQVAGMLGGAPPSP